MSQPLDTTTNLASQPTQSFNAWREEIETFCRHTVSNLQALSDAIESAEPTSLVPEVTREPTHRLVDKPPANPAPHDLDASQDRLANLKRELAAKLSNVKKGEAPTPKQATDERV